MRKILLITAGCLLAIFFLIYWYMFLYPRPFNFNILPPRDFYECQKVGGRTSVGESPNIEICTFKNKIFQINTVILNNAY